MLHAASCILSTTSPSTLYLPCTAHYSLTTIYYSRLTAHHSLLTTHYPSLTIHFPLPTAYTTTYFVQRIIYYSLFTTINYPYATYYLLPGNCLLSSTCFSPGSLTTTHCVHAGAPPMRASTSADLSALTVLRMPWRPAQRCPLYLRGRSSPSSMTSSRKR